MLSVMYRRKRDLKWIGHSVAQQNKQNLSQPCESFLASRDLQIISLERDTAHSDSWELLSLVWGKLHLLHRGLRLLQYCGVPQDIPSKAGYFRAGASKSFDQKGREDLEKQAGKGLRKKTIENYARNAQETSLSKSQDRDVLHYTFVASFSRILLGIFVIVGISLIAFSKYSKRQGHRSVKGKE